MTADTITAIVAALTPRRRQKAEDTIAAGIALCRATVEGRERKYATAPSHSQPGTVHTVTGEGCDCQGYARWHRCRHLDAVAIVLDARQPRTPEPEDAAPAESGICPECGTDLQADEGECIVCWAERECGREVA